MLNRAQLSAALQNPVDCNEAVQGVHDLTHCIEMDDDKHPFKTGTIPAGKKWSGDSAGFPVLIDIPPPSPEEEMATAEAERARLSAIAATEIVWRQDAVDAGIATDEETAALTEWKKYRVLLMRVDTAAPDFNWPLPPAL